MFHEAPKIIFYYNPSINLVKIPSDERSHSLFFPFQLLTFGKKAQNTPLCLIYIFFKSCILILSIKTGYSAEDIFLSQRRVTAEIIHGFCHDLCTVARQYGYPQDVIGELPDQRQIVL